jgi:hypothetical protein
LIAACRLKRVHPTPSERRLPLDTVRQNSSALAKRSPGPAAMPLATLRLIGLRHQRPSHSRHQLQDSFGAAAVTNGEPGRRHIRARPGPPQSHDRHYAA